MPRLASRTTLCATTLLISMLTACERPVENKPVSATTASKPSTALATPPASPPPAKVDAEATTLASLMQAAFGKQYLAQRAVAYAELPDIENRKEISRHILTGVGYTKLNDGQFVLVANAAPTGEGDDAGPAVGHASPGILNLYWIKSVDGKLSLAHKEETVAALGSNGEIGETSFVSNASGQQMLAVTHGGTWQGHTVSVLSLFHLKSNAVQALMKEGINLASDNEGGCEPESTHCWKIEGQWRFIEPVGKGQVYPDLLFAFSGEESRMPAASNPDQTSDSAKRQPKKVNGEAVYRFQKGKYVLLKGKNIIPTF